MFKSLWILLILKNKLKEKKVSVLFNGIIMEEGNRGPWPTLFQWCHASFPLFVVSIPRGREWLCLPSLYFRLDSTLPWNSSWWCHRTSFIYYLLIEGSKYEIVFLLVFRHLHKYRTGFLCNECLRNILRNVCFPILFYR